MKRGKNAIRRKRRRIMTGLVLMMITAMGVVCTSVMVKENKKRLEIQNTCKI